MEGLGGGLGDEPERRLAVPHRAARTGEGDHAERLAVEDEGRDELGLQPAQRVGPRLDPPARLVGGQVLAAGQELRLRHEAHLSAVEPHLGADLGDAALRVGRRHHEPRVGGLLPPAHEHQGLGGVEALLQYVEKGRRKLPFREAAEEVPRQVRELLQELEDRALVLFHLGPTATKLARFALEGGRAVVGLSGGRAKAEQDRKEQSGGHEQAEKERGEPGRHDAVLNLSNDRAEPDVAWITVNRSQNDPSCLAAGRILSD